MTQEGVTPVFFKNRDYVDHMRSIGKPTELTPYDVCKAVEKSVGNGTVDGAQFIRGIWRIYMKTHTSRIELLVKQELRLKDAKVILFDKNPAATRQENPDDIREKVTIKDIPLSVSHDDIKNFLTEKSVQMTTDIMYAKERDPDGKLTGYKNGNRYVYCAGPMQPLPRDVHIAGIRCRIYHKSQFGDKCRACDNAGHRPGDDKCPAMNKEDNITCFRGHLFPLSNFYPCAIKAYGKRFKSLEHAYQWHRASSLGYGDLAERIMASSHAGEAKKLSKEIAEKDDDKEANISSMKHLVHIKAQQVALFKDVLLDSKDFIAEATTDLFWGCGLKPDIAKITIPRYWPGTNMLGVLLMEVRDKIRANDQNRNDVPVITEPTEAEVEDGELLDDDQIEDDPDTTESGTPAPRQVNTTTTSTMTATAAPPKETTTIKKAYIQQAQLKTPRGRPKTKESTKRRPHSMGASPMRTASGTRNISSFWSQTRDTTPKRKCPSGTPPKEPESKAAKQGDG